MRTAWQSYYFVGVPAPAGALLVLLPVYLGIMGMPIDRVTGFASAAYTIFIGFLLISRVPVYSGKGISGGVRRDLVLPFILVAVVYVSLLMSFHLGNADLDGARLSGDAALRRPGLDAQIRKGIPVKGRSRSGPQRPR